MILYAAELGEFSFLPPGALLIYYVNLMHGFSYDILKKSVHDVRMFGTY